MSDEQEIRLDELSRFPFGLGCATLCCLVLAVVLIVIGLFVTWQASDDARLAAEVAERGRLVTVEVTGKDVSRGAAGMNQPRTTQCWLEVAPVGEAPAMDDGRAARVAVSRAEHDGAAAGDRIEVWQVDDRYVLDRVVSDPTPPVVGYALLGAGGLGIAATIALLRVVVRRVKNAAIGP